MTTPELAIARAFAEADMKSTCTITRAGDGEPVFDDASGIYTDPPRVPVYTGRCKVRDTARSVADAEAGDVQAGVVDRALHLPIEGSGQVRRDDVAQIDSNPDDPALIGRTFVIRVGDYGTTKTARRLPIEEVV